ncbi:hypothetical protein [Weissella cibaria]|uniref:hypothetical protein n=1 Tax=Weissella cibaria TaxID=137591 RepID=UPI001E2D87E3|nr:hypothetical protein [Weissella cibaria]
MVVRKECRWYDTVAGLPAGVYAVVSFDPNAVNAAAAVMSDAAKQTMAGNAAAEVANHCFRC